MITRQDIVVGNVIQFLKMGQYEIVDGNSTNKAMRIKETSSTADQYYLMEDYFLQYWSVVERVSLLSINDIIVNEVYTDGTEKYRVVYKNGKCILAYIQDKVQEMPVLYTQDDISSWKKYVPPVIAKEYKIVWRHGGVNNMNKITAEFLPRNKVVKDPQNIIKTELISYTE